MRLNITLPENLSQKIALFPNKSRFIAEAIKEKLEKMKKEEINRLIAEGYQNVREEDAEIDEDWEGATLERW